MSHFTVLVIGDNIEEQFAPYSEELEVDPYQEDCWCRGSLARKSASETASKTWDSKTHHSVWCKLYDEVLEKDQKPDPVCRECYGTGSRSTTYNPKSKWDWYTVGGRWLGFFKLKPDAEGVLGMPGAFKNKASLDADQARKKDIDFETMERFHTFEAEQNWLKAQSEKDDTKFWLYDIKKDETKEQYIKRNSRFSTFAVLKEGEWFEKGEMGWWGMVSNEQDEDKWQEEFNKLVDSLPDDILLTIVDCHI